MAVIFHSVSPNTVLSGNGAPSSGLGVDGDFYIDKSVKAIYGPKINNSWGNSTSLIGPPVAPSYAIIACSDEITPFTASTDRARFRIPFAATLTGVRANVNTAPTGSAVIIDINKNGSSILGTKLSIDVNETSSTTASSIATIINPVLASDDEISIDIDQVTTGATGLKVTFFLTPIPV